MVIAGIVDQSLPQRSGSPLDADWPALIFAVIGVLVALVAQFYSAKGSGRFYKRSWQTTSIVIFFLYPKDSERPFDNFSLVTRLTSDTYQIQTGINQFLRLFFGAPIIVFGAIFMTIESLAWADLSGFGHGLSFWPLSFVGLSRLVNPLYSSLRRERTNWFRKHVSNYKACELFVLLDKKNEKLQIFQTLNQVILRLQEKTGFWSVY